MALTFLPEPKNRLRKISAYDLEWYPDRLVGQHGRRWGLGDPVRMAGVFDEDRGYRCYETVEDFIEGEFTDDQSGRWFYAHAGGLTDVQFVLERLITRSDIYKVSAAFSGSSAVVVQVKRGRSTWKLIDSYFTIRRKLSDIGHTLKMEKGAIAFDTDDIFALQKYNRIDCEILYRAMIEFQNVVLGLGSELNVTLASTALRLIRRRYLDKDNPIQTFPYLNKKLRSAYVGGRTEVYKYGRSGRTYVYDVNSAYMWAMTQPIPGNYHGPARTLPPENSPFEYIADITVKIRDDVKIPPLPHLMGGKSLFFGTGEFRGWFCRPEIEAALRHKLLHERDMTVHGVELFRRMDNLKKFSEEIYQLRREAKGREEDGYEQFVLKELGCSGYGKLAENTLKQQLLINPDRKTLIDAENWHRLEKGRLAGVREGVFMLETDREIPHQHIAGAAYVTSWARALLLDKLMGRRIVLYCDTDSIFTPERDVETSSDLGALKLEKKLQALDIRAPKFYRAHFADAPLDLSCGYDEDGQALPLDKLLAKQLVDDGRALSSWVEKQGRIDPGELDRWLMDLDEDEFQAAVQGLTDRKDPSSSAWDLARLFAEPAYRKVKNPTSLANEGQLVIPFGKHMIRLKGFSNPTMRNYDALVRGEAVPNGDRMLRVRELLANGEISPRAEERVKEVQGRACPKRRVHGDGSTSAWNVRHLKATDEQYRQGKAPWQLLLREAGVWKPKDETDKIGRLVLPR
jgi:hypothetical protein